MKNFCYQGSEHDCGFAALKMLFSIISKNQNYLYLPKGSHSEPYSLLDLIEIAATHQVNLSGYELEFKKLPEQRFPCLVEVNEKHMVVVTKYKKPYFYVSDPARGKLKMRYDELQKIYAGHALLIESEELDRKFKAEKPRLMPISYGIVHAVVASVLIAMLGLDFYLMNLSENVPFIFMLIMFLIIVEVFENWYLLKMSDYFDNRYIPLFFRKESHQNQDDYKKFLGIKVSLFQSSKSIVVFASLAIILGVLVSINEPKNLLVIALIAIYKSLEKYLTQKKDDETVKEMSRQETVAFNNKDKAVNQLLSLNKKSNQFGMVITTRNCFFQLILMLLTLFMMVLSNNMSANYAVFHFGIYFIIGQGISLIVNRLTDHQEQQKNLAQFYDKCGL